ncbi:replication protein A 70 kDa DNA-binding subunit B, partial [Tanacetum coccineum]
MLDDLKILARCISIWKAHPAGNPYDVWSFDIVLQDPQGNRVQATCKKDHINKFQLLLDEGSCYRIDKLLSFFKVLHKLMSLLDILKVKGYYTYVSPIGHSTVYKMKKRGDVLSMGIELFQ